MRGIRRNNTSGSAIIGALILTAIAALVLSGLLSVLATGVKNEALVSDRSIDYYAVEEEFRNAVTWMRDNSKNLLTPFTRSQFYSSFDRASPAYGSNDNSVFKVPTRLRLNGGNDSAILVSDDILATAAFPTTQVNKNGAAYNAQSEFAAYFAGANAKLRVTLVDAIPATPSADYGDTDQGNPTPATDFYPIYRIDSMADLFDGAHVYGFLVGQLEESSSSTIFGFDGLRIAQTCDAYDSSKGAYNPATNRTAQCKMSAGGEVRIQSGDIIYGGLSTTGTLFSAGGWDGKVCANFTAGCPVAGTTCIGGSCSVGALGAVPAWNTVCPQSQGDLTIKKDATLDINNALPKMRCWDQVTVNAGITVTLNNVNYPYQIKDLNLKNNAKVLIVPAQAGKQVNLVLSTISHTGFTGADIVTSVPSPSAFKFTYYDSKQLTLSGTNDFYAHINMPAARMVFGGTFNFFGTINAKDFHALGDGLIHTDTAGVTSQLEDLGYTLEGYGEYFR